MTTTSPAAGLVHELEALGAQLWEEDGQLRFRAPRGVMTDERRAAIGASREELLAYLREVEAAGLVPEPVHRYEPFPLSDIQSAYVLGRRAAFAYGGVGCHAYGELVYPDLDPERVTRAWHGLVERHDMLRAVIADGSQRIQERVPPLPVGVRDVRGRPAGEFDAALAQVRSELDHRVYRPDEWPLFAVRVTRGDCGAVLHLSIDFLIADFVSIQLLLDEFHLRYADPERTFPALDLTYRDYLLGERRLRRTRRYDRDRLYWWDRLDSLPGAPDLPVRSTSDSHGAVRFRRLNLALNAAAYAALNRAATGHEVTVTAAVLAAYAEVVGRWSRRQRFVLTLTTLARLPVHPRVNELVGDFTSALLLEVDAGGGATFQERAARLQERLWDDLDHRLVSGVEVLREVARRRGQDAALMPVVFTSALGLGTVAAPSGAFAPDAYGYGISQTPQVWIDCQALERCDGLELNWDVREGVFPAGLVEDMFAAFADLVRALGSGQRWGDAVPVALPRPQLDRRGAVNDTAAPVPDALLHDGVVAQCLRTPSRPAVLTRDRSLSYGELLSRAGAVASAVRDRGCAPGGIVAVLLDTGPEQVVAVLGTLLAGGVYLPVDTRAPAARRAAIVADAGARLVLTNSTVDCSGLAAPVVLVDTLAEPAAGPPPPRVTPDDLAYVIYTSGSTGRPKGVAIPHRGAANTVADINRRFAVGPDDRVLGLASLSFDLSVYDIFGPLSTGGALVLPDHDRRGDPSHWVDLVRSREVTLWNSVPAQLQMLHDYLAAEPGVDLPTLRLALASGDWIPVRLPDQVRSRLPGIELVSLGGATEASIWSIAHPIGEVPSSWTSIPYGRPLANQTFHVLDERQRDCPDWTVGELYIGGAGLAEGYLGDPDQTAHRFVTNPWTGERLYRTGDFGRYWPDGTIEFLGREDLQVKIRGHRIELAEIEAALQDHPAVGAAAVAVEGDGVLDRRLAAFVEPARRRPDPDGADELRSAARAELVAAHSRVAADRAVAFARVLDEAALVAMLATLRAEGLFATASAAHTVAEVLDGARVVPRHHRLIRRWLKALRQEGMLREDPATGVVFGAPALGPADVDAAWRRVDELAPDGGQRSELIEYFRTASANLPGLVHGEVDPVRLLFPEGQVSIQESAYQGNFLSGTLNRLVVAVIRRLAARRPAGGLRLLEVGAGVGGTSAELIPALAEFAPEYLFTDVSQFFLNGARVRYAQYPWVRYGLFDLNEHYRAQGLAANTFDVILCANVLHYAKHAGHALSRLRELLAPGGWLVFIETTRDNYQILTSMEFLFDEGAGDFDDVRAGRDETFISADDWRRLLSEAQAQPVLWLSEEDGALRTIGMHVFAARFKADREPLSADAVRRQLGERLPEYMVPARIEVLDALPLTDNGKVDRTALRALVPAGTVRRGAATAAPGDGLEAAIAELWVQVLNVDRVGREEDIFALGGDSLLAAQLVGRIRDEVPEAADAFFDSLLRDLLEGATVASLAAALDRSPEPPSAGVGDAVQWRVIDDTGEGALRILLPDGTGDIASVRQRCAAGPPTAGIVMPDAAAYLRIEPDILVQRQATACAFLVAERAVGPVALCGLDFGGLLAVEVARQLVETGYPVAELTVMVTAAADGDAPPVVEHSRLAASRHTVAAYAGDITLVLAFDPTEYPDPAARATEFWKQICIGQLRVETSP